MGTVPQNPNALLFSPTVRAEVRETLRLLGRDDSGDAAEAVAELIAGELGWSADDAAASVDAYRSSLVHERDSAGLPETHLAELLKPGA